MSRKPGTFARTTQGVFILEKVRIMDQEKLKEIKQIMGEMTCTKGFKCAASGFQKVCKANDHGVDDVLLCLEEDHVSCNFVVLYGENHYCQCPLRVHLAKKLKI